MKEAKISVRFDEECGRIKPMHATNNGPTKGRGFGSAKTRGFEDWREAGIPYARTHDSSFNAGYGGEHTVDVHAIFPNFDADVSDPASYDFAFTDQYLSNIRQEEREQKRLPCFENSAHIELHQDLCPTEYLSQQAYIHVLSEKRNDIV